MSSDFFAVDQEDLDVADKLMFKHKEIVEFVCTDFVQNAQKGSLMLKVNVLTGDHAGKKTTLYMTSNDTEVSKKIKAQFLKAFWSREEIVNRQASPKKLLSRRFSAVSRLAEKEAKGNQAATTFQNWEEFTDLGQYQQAAPQAAQPSHAPAPQQAPQAAPAPAVTGASPSF